MRTAFYLAYLRLRRAPLRLCLVLLTITVTVCIALWFAAGYDTLMANADRDAAAMVSNADLLLFPRRTAASSLNAGLLAELKRDSAVASLAVFAPVDVNLAGKKGSETPPPMYGLPRRTPSLVGTDAVDAPLEMVAGRWLSGKEGEAIADVQTAVRRRWKTGTVIRIRSAAGFYSFRLVGIIAENPAGKRFSAISDSDLLRPPPSRAIYVSLDDARKCAGGRLEIAYASLRQKIPLEHWMKRLESAHVMCFSRENIRSALHDSASAGSARMQVFSAGSVSLLVAFFIVFSILNMEVDEQRRHFAMLRMTGFTRRQLFLILFFEALLFALSGWVCGLSVGTVLLKLWNLPLHIGFWSIAVSGIFSCIATLGAALFPALRAASVMPMDIFAKQEPAISAKRIRVLFHVGILLLPVNPLIVFLPAIPENLRIVLYGFAGCPVQVAAFLLMTPQFLRWGGQCLRGMFAFAFRLNPLLFRSQLDAGFKRGALLTAALSAGLGFYMMIVIWSASLLLPFLPGEWMPDLFALIVPGGLKNSDMARVERLTSVKKALPVAVEQVKLAGDLTGSRSMKNVVRQDNVVFMGLDVHAAYEGADALLPFVYLEPDRESALRLLKTGGNYCLIPAHFALVTGLRSGDSFEVIPPDAPETRLRYTAAGVIEFKGWHWFSKMSGTRRHESRTAAMLFGSYGNIARNFNLNRVNFIWMNLNGDVPEKELRRELAALAAQNRGEKYHIAGGGEGEISQEYVKLVSRSFLKHSILNRTEQVVNGMLNLPLVILGATTLAVASAAFGAVHARRRELRIMRMAGLSAFGAVRLVIAEFLLIGTVASAVSLLFGIFSGVCSAQMASSLSFFGGMGWNFSIPWGRVAAGCLIVLGVCFAGTLIPALLQMRRKFFDCGNEE